MTTKNLNGKVLTVSQYCPMNSSDVTNGVWAVDDPSNYIHTHIINRTPHQVNLYSGDEILILEKCDNPLRVTAETITVDLIEGVRTTKQVFGKCEQLPSVQHHTYYIVSAIVKNAHPERTDLLTINEAVRDEMGNIIGCKSFAV